MGYASSNSPLIAAKRRSHASSSIFRKNFNDTALASQIRVIPGKQKSTPRIWILSALTSTGAKRLSTILAPSTSSTPTRRSLPPQFRDQRIERDSLLNISAYQLHYFVNLRHRLANPGEIDLIGKGFQIAADIPIANLAPTLL